jgi:hypothetical protein
MQTTKRVFLRILSPHGLIGLGAGALLPVAGFVIILLLACFRCIPLRDQSKKRDLASLFKYLLLPAIGFIIIFYVWMSLQPQAKIVGFSWLALGCTNYLRASWPIKIYNRLTFIGPIEGGKLLPDVLNGKFVTVFHQ